MPDAWSGITALPQHTEPTRQAERSSPCGVAAREAMPAGQRSSRSPEGTQQALPHSFASVHAIIFPRTTEFPKPRRIRMYVFAPTVPEVPNGIAASRLPRKPCLASHSVTMQCDMILRMRELMRMAATGTSTCGRGVAATTLAMWSIYNRMTETSYWKCHAFCFVTAETLLF